MQLDAEEPITLQAIGDHFGMTREAARLVEKKVLAKAREFLRSELKDLKDFEIEESREHKAESPVAAIRM